AVAPRFDVRGLEWAEPRLLGIDGEPDATPLPRLRVPRGLVGARTIVVETPEQLVEETRIVARVVDGVDAERPGADVVRHVGHGNEVATPDLRRVEPETRRPPVQEPLPGKVALRTSRRAQRSSWRLVGDDGPEIARIIRHAVGAGEQRGAELRGDQRGR